RARPTVTKTPKSRVSWLLGSDVDGRNVAADATRTRTDACDAANGTSARRSSPAASDTSLRQLPDSTVTRFATALRSPRGTPVSAWSGAITTPVSRPPTTQNPAGSG